MIQRKYLSLTTEMDSIFVTSVKNCISKGDFQQKKLFFQNSAVGDHSPILKKDPEWSRGEFLKKVFFAENRPY